MKQGSLAVVAVVVVSLAAGCGSVQEQPTPPDAAPDVADTGLALAVDAGPRFVAIAGQLAIEVRLTRRAVDGPVAITLSAAPTGVSAEPLTIAAGMDRGTLIVRAAVDAPFVRGSIELRAMGGGETAGATVPVEVTGRPGTLDITFGTNGVQTFAASDKNETPVFALPQGDKVIVGIDVTRNTKRGLLVLRRNRDGANDPTFGTAGELFLDLTTAAGGPLLVVSFTATLQPDGKLLIGGAVGVNLEGFPYLVRYTADGQPDPSLPFRMLTTVGGINFFSTLAVGPGGDIALAGMRGYLGGGSDPIAVRFDSTGAVVTGFGTNGIACPFTPGTDSIRAAELQADGKLVMLLEVVDITGQVTGGVLRRFDTAGQLDATFGTAGVTTLAAPDGSTNVRATTMLRLDGDQLLVGGAIRTSQTAADKAVWRFLATGAPDLTFGGTDGIYTPAAATAVLDEVLFLARAADGSILGVGHNTPSGTTEARPFLLRLSAEGVADASFGTEGIVAEAAISFVRRIALRPDRRVITVGSPPAAADTNDTTMRSYWY